MNYSFNINSKNFNTRNCGSQVAAAEARLVIQEEAAAATAEAVWLLNARVVSAETELQAGLSERDAASAAVVELDEKLQTLQVIGLVSNTVRFNLSRFWKVQR